jgi:hypothetical protein
LKLPFSQSTQYKSYVKYSNLPLYKISHFSQVPKFFFHLLSHLLRKSKMKSKFKIRKSSRAVFLRVDPALQRHPAQCASKLAHARFPPRRRCQKGPAHQPAHQSETASLHGPTCRGYLPPNSLPYHALAGVVAAIPVAKRGHHPRPHATAMPTCAPASLSRRIPPRTAEWPLHAAAAAASLHRRCAIIV